jgi:hypothetical protein
VVEQRADLAIHRAGDEQVPFVERAVLNEDGRHWTAATIELRLEHGALRHALGVGLHVGNVGDEQQHLEQLIEVLLLPRGHFDRDGRSAPFFRHQSEVR